MLTDNLPVSDKPVFWLIFVRGGLIPVFNDVNKAIEEAERLTKKHNEPHTILKAVGIVRPVEIQTILEEIREWPTDQ